MRQPLMYIILLFLFGCEQSHQTQSTTWQTFEIGEYLFDFPPDFKFIQENGIDSHTGKIEGDSLTISFDFGYYSNSLAESPQEYLKSKRWEFIATARNMQVTESTIPKLNVLHIRPATIADSSIGKGCQFVAKCEVKNKQFDFAICLPAETKAQNFVTDTIGNIYKKIVFSKETQKGTAGIYLKRLDSFDETINGYLALSMETSGLTESKQNLAVKIFETARLRSKK